MSQLYSRAIGMVSMNAGGGGPHQQQRNEAAPPPAVEACAARREDAALDFANKRDALLTCLDESSSLVADLAGFNDAKWEMHYPQAKLGYLDVSLSSSSSSSSTSSLPPTPARGAGPIDVPSSIESLSAGRPAGRDDGRSPSPAPSVRSGSGAAAPSSSNHPLAIDLRLGAPGQSVIAELMHTMSDATKAQLLSQRFDVAKKQIDKLSSRVKDNQSRILVTGDLNAGKSTFVNALLRRDILPTDQQPLTTVFCEVLDAQAFNDGKEEVHAVFADKVGKYDRTDEEAFERFPLDKLQEIATDDDQRYGIVKVYLKDARVPLSSTTTAVFDHDGPAQVDAHTNGSFIRNGIVSISLIDGPGLNRDNYSTTALFTRQTELDVIVFVVQADYGITLSANEFVRHASMDKALVFIVVNKFDGVRDKVRCERRVLEQLRWVLPETWEQREELVHFVEAETVIRNIHDIESGKTNLRNIKDNTAFTHLEESLRSFLLLKRSISKLAPAKTYLAGLLNDLSIVTEDNFLTAEKAAEDAYDKLKTLRPIHERLQQEKEAVDEAVGKEEDDRVREVKAAASKRLTAAVDAVVKDDREQSMSPVPAIRIPDYPGLLEIWDWAAQVKTAFLEYLESQVVAAEEEARTSTIEGVELVQKDLAQRFLPVVEQAAQQAGSTASGAASALPQRVFNSQLMFSKRRQALRKHNSQRTGQPVNLSKALYLQQEDLEISYLDMFDLNRLLSLPSTLAHFGKTHRHDNALIETTPSALSAVSLGVGAVTMFGTRVVGVKSVIEAITTLCEVLGSKAARKWAGPIAAVLTLALGAYLVHDLPRAVPHNIGRKLHAVLVSSDFSTAESDRIAFETRKVMRLCGWDLRERFHAALEASAQDRRDMEGKLKQANEALAFLEHYLDRVERQQATVKEISL